MNKKKMKYYIIGGSLAILICGSVFVTYKTLHNKDVDQAIMRTETQKKINKQVDDVIKKDKTLTDAEKKKMSEDEKAYSVMGDSYAKVKNTVKLGDPNSSEYPKEKTDELYKELIGKAEVANIDRGDYEGILNEIEATARSYRFYEEYNWKIANVYHDANLLNETSDVKDPTGKGYLVSQMTDPQMFVIGTLMIPEEARRNVITDKTSLSPSFSGPVRIREVKKYNLEKDTLPKDSIIDDMFDRVFSMQNIYKITFEIEGHAMIAYVAQFPDGGLQFYTMQKVGDEYVPYRTVQYWIDLDKQLKK